MHDILITRDKTNLGSNSASKLIKKAIFASLEAQKVEISCEISVLLTDDDGIREINRDFRDTDKVTDVLSFPLNELIAGEFDPEICEENFETGKIMLGDIIISLPQARRQGEEFSHGEEREISYLTIHSVLHLLGYDHLDEAEEKAKMREREKSICEKLGI